MKKLYTDPDGKFQMYIPIEWEYKNPSFYNYNHAPHSFGLYENLIGAFQISCKLVNEHIDDLIKTKYLEVQTSDSNFLDFTESSVKSDSKDSYLFSCAVDDHFIFATYIVDASKNPDKKTASELCEVKESLRSIKFIKPEFRNIVIALRRVRLFMLSIATVIDLRNKALENGSFIELVILTANHIDALLRLSIILSNQLNNSTREIDISYLYQDKNDKPIMERQIYKIALDRNIINSSVLSELELLYAERNKVVHRYIITDIRTEDVLEISRKYFDLDEKISSIVKDLEKKQSELKIGIYGNRDNLGQAFNDTEYKELKTGIRDKHGRINWGK